MTGGSGTPPYRARTRWPRRAVRHGRAGPGPRGRTRPYGAQLGCHDLALGSIEAPEGRYRDARSTAAVVDE